MNSPPIEWVTYQLKELFINATRQGPVPRHVGFVMDGNRRFAKKNHIETAEGHNMGFDALAKAGFTIAVCYKSGVEAVTVYAFSIENFKRPLHEVNALMEIAKFKLNQICQHGDLLDRFGVKLRVLGQLDLVREDVREVIDEAIDITKDNNKCVLNICFPYTSRNEITTAVRSIVNLSTTPNCPPSPSFSDSSTTSTASSKTALAGLSDFESITEQTLTEHMFTSDSPPLDLLIRTSGVRRLSDFLLWQCHQDTEIVFVDCLWPQFDIWHFLPILTDWAIKQKKKDKTAAAMRRQEEGLGQRIPVR
ncbi:Di-trans-poly-cis-decaprenylcistransferase [Ascodesmis nigricans]|uniref:Alkyl transferase n=1 Tax=Ascodesmis nigricans TaxID=341454 RepID=A0A4S2N6F6_9PEZI|nr:Di-trans-poly-cis-decaprenylcistransferase [Ascodesmis nigricans]